MQIIATRSGVAAMLQRLRVVGKPNDWATRFIDPTTGKRWSRLYVDAEQHGGDHAILVPDPTPSVRELLLIAATSPDPAEVAASAWLLVDRDREGNSREHLVAVAESAADAGDPSRAALVVGWGKLTDANNLRPTLGKRPAEVTEDHNYFKSLAERAKRTLRLSVSDPLLRDPQVFEGEPE
jgi:hypothetical protein